MTRRTKAAVEAGQPASAAPTEYVGRNDRGAVRPADDRYLADAELDARDAYLLEVTGPDAQQLVAKREAVLVRLEALNDLDRVDLDSINTMPNAEYRDLLESLDQALEDQAKEGETA